MKPETKFILLRVSIYLTGFLIVAWVIGINIWEIKQKTAPLIKVSDNQYIVYTERNYDQAELTLEFEKEIPENLRVEINPELSAFLSHRDKVIYNQDALLKKLFNANPTSIPNGSFVKYKKNIYFLEDGFLRRVLNKDILKKFSLDKNKLPEIEEKELKLFQPGENLTLQSMKEKFPEKIIIKRNNYFYITGKEAYYPIYLERVEKIIENLDYYYLETKSNPKKGKCFKKSKKEALCEFNLKENRDFFNDIYSIESEQMDNLIKGKIKLSGNPSAEEFIRQIIGFFSGK